MILYSSNPQLFAILWNSCTAWPKSPCPHLSSWDIPLGWNKALVAPTKLLLFQAIAGAAELATWHSSLGQHRSSLGLCKCRRKSNQSDLTDIVKVLGGGGGGTRVAVRVGAVGWLNSCLGEVVEFLFVTLKQKLNEPLYWGWLGSEECLMCML